MADFVLKKTVYTKAPKIEVQPGLPPGTYVFEMVPVTEKDKHLPAQKIKIVIKKPV